MVVDLIENLRGEIAAGRVTCIVGAGVSIASSYDPNRKPNVASWIGLLEDGIARCAAVVPGLPARWPKQMRGNLELGKEGDTEMLLGVAEQITVKLGGSSGGEFKRWLRETVGELRVRHPEVPLALAALAVPLLTTNYDNIIEQASRLPGFDWRDTADVERVVRGEDRGVVHVHGHWRRSENLVLGVRSYEDVTRSPHAQAVLRALRMTTTLLFVGFGAGLDDPNFGALRRWSSEVFASSEVRHYRLVLAGEKDAVQAQHKPEERVFVLSYGEEHAALASFLTELIHKDRPPEPTRLPVPTDDEHATCEATEKAEDERRAAPKVMEKGDVEHIDPPETSRSEPDELIRTITESKLIERVEHAFQPGTAISTQRHLQGRERELTRLRSILAQPGMHAIISGERASGKTSLARVSAPMGHDFQCTSGDYGTLLRSLITKIRQQHQDKFSASPQAHYSNADLCDTLIATGKRAVLIFDEVDGVQSDTDYIKQIALLCKLLSDKSAAATLLVGIDISSFLFVKHHNSLSRSMQEVSVAPLADTHLTRILTLAEEDLGNAIRFSEEAVSAILRVADGGPFMVHLLGQESARRTVFRQDSDVSLDDVLRATTGPEAVTQAAKLESAYISNTTDELSRKIIDLVANSASRRASESAIVAHVAKNGFSSSDVRAALANLMRAPILRHPRNTHYIEIMTEYAFADPHMAGFVKFWLHENADKKQ